MADGWDLSGGDKVQFTKFGVGISRIRILSVAPKVRWTHWLPKFQRSINCPGRGCPIDEIRKREKANKLPQTYGMSRKFSMNVWNYETNRLEIMEQGITFMEDLKDIMSDLKEQGHKLEDAIIKVRRRGTGKDDTTYRIDIDEIVEKETAILNAEPVDLDEYFKPHTPEQILKVLEVVETSTEDYQKRWNEIMYPEDAESDEPSETEESTDNSEEDFQVE